MPYLILNNQQAADDRSRQAWEQVLGRQKNPADVTEFLWGRSAPGLDGRVAVVIPSDNTTWGISQDEVNSVT
jgi:hypothetical protein